MNERIKELAEQCGFRPQPSIYDRNQSFDIEKFAELIVKECAELVRVQNEQFMENESHYGVVSADILKHFGVK